MWVTLDLQNLEIRLFEASMRAWASSCRVCVQQLL
jgi:hypothetical protein